MSVIDIITEQVFKVSTNPELADYFFRDVLSRQEDSEWHAHCVYVEDEKKELICGHIFSADVKESSLGNKDGFRSYLRKVDPKQLKDFMFVIDSYDLAAWDHSGNLKSDFDELLSPTFRKVPILDDILEDSRGWLIWHHQLEWLLKLFLDSTEKCIRFRKDINQAKAETFREAETIELANGFTLADALSERMIRRYITHYPSVKGACTLLRLFSN